MKGVTGITVKESGTGGGFRRFGVGMTDINNSSRRPDPEELALFKQNNISYMEFKVATDGIAVVTHPENRLINSLTVQELRRIWINESKVTYWSDIRPQWPSTPINLYGPGLDSGTRDYFEEVIMGKNDKMRTDYIMSEHDDELVRDVANDPGGLSFFGLAYYHQNKSKLKSIAINNGSGPVSPTYANVKKGSYKPLVRTLFLHVNSAKLENAELVNFLLFYMRMAPNMVNTAGYVPFSRSVYQRQYNQLKNRRTELTSK